MGFSPVFVHVPGYSAWDHYAQEVISVAERLVKKEYSRKWNAKRAGEHAAYKAWRLVRSYPATGPRIDVEAKKGGTP